MFTVWGGGLNYAFPFLHVMRPAWQQGNKFLARKTGMERKYGGGGDKSQRKLPSEGSSSNSRQGPRSSSVTGLGSDRWYGGEGRDGRGTGAGRKSAPASEEFRIPSREISFSILLCLSLGEKLARGFCSQAAAHPVTAAYLGGPHVPSASSPQSNALASQPARYCLPLH